MRISNSEIQAFKRCRRKWWLAYYRRLGLKKEQAYGARSIGNRVHGCVAEYYSAFGAGPGQTRALDLHDWSVALDLERCPEQEADIKKDADLSRAMLEGYFQWLEETGADEGLEVIGAEKSVEATIDVVTRDVKAVVPVTVSGKLDLRVRRDGEDSFLDHKTVQEFTTPTRTLHLDEQMLMYHWLVDEVDGVHVGGVVYNMLRKVKRTAAARPPFYERFEVQHSPAEVTSFFRRLLGTLRQMIEVRADLEAGADPLQVVYPTPNRNCSWDCDFFPVCHLIDRPQDKPEHMLQWLYTEVDPYARYADASGEVS